MKKQIAVIGLGSFGYSVALKLTQLGHEVLGIDKDEARVNESVNDFTHVVACDAGDEESLRSLGLKNFDIAVIAIGNDIQTNILVSLMVKEMGVKKVVTKADNILHGKVLDKIGVDQIVYPERDMGIRVAHNLSTSNVMDYLELSEEYGIVEIVAPEKFTGKTLGELNLRAEYGLSAIAIKKNGDVLVNPGADAYISPNDILVIVGEVKNINRL